MQTIGEKLEEARKSRGIKIREAAQATKIREDFLIGFESNSIDLISLPYIYVRSFMKNYCDYLKLDRDKMLLEFDAMHANTSKPQSREAYAKPDATDYLEKDTLPDLEEQKPRSSSRKKLRKLSLDSALSYKIPLIVVGFVILVGLGYLLIRAISPGESSGEAGAAGAFSGDDSAAHHVAAGSDNLKKEAFKLIATGDVFVTITQLLGNKRLYSGSLAKGEEVSLSKSGQVRIIFDEGKNLMIEKDGERTGIDRGGNGRLAL